MYNPKVIEALVVRFNEIAMKLDTVGTGDSDKTDIYSFLASIMYDMPYEECCEFTSDGKPNHEGKDLRNRAKQFVLPVIVKCGGLFDEATQAKMDKEDEES